MYLALLIHVFLESPFTTLWTQIKPQDELARRYEASMQVIEREKLRQDCAKGTATVNALSEALTLLQPDGTYLPHGAMANELLDKESGLACSVRSLLWLMLSTY
jgi:hypothetical protein